MMIINSPDFQIGDKRLSFEERFLKILYLCFVKFPKIDGHCFALYPRPKVRSC